MLNEEENLTVEYLEEKSSACWEKIKDDPYYQKIEKDKKNIENCSIYLEFKERINRLHDEIWELESHINWALSILEEDIAVKGRFDEKHWSVRRLANINRLPTQKRIEKIIEANKNGK